MGPYARNRDIGKYWHRFVMSLKKAGYRFDYLWVKEFQKNGKLHLHALVTAFILECDKILLEACNRKHISYRMDC